MPTKPSRIKELDNEVTSSNWDLEPELTGQLKYRVCQLYQKKIDRKIPGEQDQYTQNTIELLKSARDDFESAGNKVSAARCLDNIAGLLIESGEVSRAEKYAKQSRDLLVSKPGYSNDRAAVYGNLFSIYLAKSIKENNKIRSGKLKKAEGYFFESNLNYISNSRIDGVIKNICTLSYACIKANSKQVDRLPTIKDVYQYGHLLWRENPSQHSELINLFGIIHNQIYNQNNGELLKKTAPITAILAFDLEDMGDVLSSIDLRFTVIVLAHQMVDNENDVHDIVELLKSEHEVMSGIINWFFDKVQGKQENLDSVVNNTRFEQVKQRIENMADDAIRSFDDTSMNK